MWRIATITALRGPADSEDTSRLKRLLDLLTHLPRHRQVMDAIGAAALEPFLNRQPQLVLKYLSHKHLVSGISTSDRAAAMICHYNILRSRFASEARSAILDGGAHLWAHDSEPGHHTITLKFSHPTDNEGELTLEYAFNHALIYVLSFSFVPGALVGNDAEAILLLTRIQGTRALFPDIRTAMKSLHGLGAPALLMAALEGVANRLGFTRIVGVSAARQVCNGAEHENFPAAYDRFFAELGAAKINDFYCMTLPFVEKPITGIKRSNRKRVQLQRQIKRDATNSAMQNIDVKPVSVCLLRAPHENSTGVAQRANRASAVLTFLRGIVGARGRFATIRFTHGPPARVLRERLGKR